MGHPPLCHTVTTETIAATIAANVCGMTYILRIGPWHVGPFSTHVAAQHFAEQHGCDDFTMIPLDDPVEAPGKLYRLRMAPLKHPMMREICAKSA